MEYFILSMLLDLVLYESSFHRFRLDKGIGFLIVFGGNFFIINEFDIGGST